MVNPIDKAGGILTSENHQNTREIQTLAQTQGISLKQIRAILPRCLERVSAGEQLEVVVLEEILKM